MEESSAMNSEMPSLTESIARMLVTTSTHDSSNFLAQTGPPALASRTLVPIDRSRVVFPDMFEPVTMDSSWWSLSCIVINASRLRDHRMTQRLTENPVGGGKGRKRPTRVIVYYRSEGANLL